MGFKEIVAEVKDNKDFYVDARNYKSNWSIKWVAYCDLIGFANTCLLSNDSTINAIARFHRAVSRAKSLAFESKVYQFTDASFCVSDNKFEVLNFAINVAQFCLAHNSIIMETKKHSMFHHMIIPRITIASGSIISLDGTNKPDLLSGLNKDSFLAGSAIVNAYYLETKTFAGAISVKGGDLEEILSGATIRGGNDAIRKTLNRWKSSYLKGLNEGKIVDIPYAFISKVTDKGEIWSETKDEAKKKLQILIEISEKMTSEFVACDLEIALGKHQVGLQRHLYHLLCMTQRQVKVDMDKFRNLGKFLAAI